MGSGGSWLPARWRLASVLGCQGFEACVDLGSREPASLDHHTDTIREVIEVIERVRSQEDQVRTLTWRHRSEMVVELEMLSNVPTDGYRPALENLLVRHTGFGHDVDLAVECESRDVEELGGVRTHHDGSARIGEILENPVTNIEERPHDLG